MKGNVFTDPWIKMDAFGRPSLCLTEIIKTKQATNKKKMFTEMYMSWDSENTG